MTDLVRIWSACPNCGGRVHCRTWESPMDNRVYAKLYCIKCFYSEQFATDMNTAFELIEGSKFEACRKSYGV